MPDLDDGARDLGEFAIGTNEGITEFTGDCSSTRRSAARSTWRWERRIPSPADLNSPALHWDMVCDLRPGGEVYADGEVIYRDGRFLERPLLIALFGDTHLPARRPRRFRRGASRLLEQASISSSTPGT